MRPTLVALVEEARLRLLKAGLAADDARLDAELLAREALGWDRARYIAYRRQPAPPSFAARYAPLVERRAGREPLAYIVGHREFWGLELEVSPHVLIPRPETELIVEEVLARRAALPDEPLIIDVGTGSGCVAIALAVAVPQARLVATDLSPQALAVARRNAERHGVAARLQCIEGSLLDAVTERPDVVVSNPPYVAEADGAALPPEIRNHEPRLALVAGADGLEVIRALVDQAARRLGRDGLLVFEIGAGQIDAVQQLIDDAIWTSRRVRSDLLGVPRTVALVRG